METLLANAVAEGLRRENLAVDVVYDRAAALEKLSINTYDVLVLDRDLPKVPGDDVCRAAVDMRLDMRILMLTAADAIIDQSPG